MRQGRIGQARVAGMAGHKRTALALAATALLTGCGQTTFNNPFSTAPPVQEDVPTISERFDQLFGSRGKVPEIAADGTEVDCPVVKVRAGASTYGVAPPGKQPVASELNYQATITRTARECRRAASGQITARIGILGRVIVGPAGAPATSGQLMHSLGLPFCSGVRLRSGADRTTALACGPRGSIGSDAEI